MSLVEEIREFCPKWEYTEFYYGGMFYGQSCSFAWPENEKQYFSDRPRYNNSCFYADNRLELIFVQQEGETYSEFIRRVRDEC